MRQQSIIGFRGVRAGSCRAWPLPADATCATVARQVLRDAVSEVGLEPDLLGDCVLMASELAANTLHARAVAGTGGGGDRLVSVAPDMGGEPISSAGLAPHTPHTPQAVPGCPELWLYLRGLGIRRELVCKVFDGYRGWRHGSAPSVSRVAAQAVSGRGLQIVHELSRGTWGAHPTRARLGGWGLRGKAVWFAVPAPLAHARLVDVTGLRAYTLSADVTATRANQRLSARQAARELEAMLDERGFSGRLVRVAAGLGHVGALRLPRPDRVVPVRHRVADHPGGRPEGVELPTSSRPRSRRCGGTRNSSSARISPPPRRLNPGPGRSAAHGLGHPRVGAERHVPEPVHVDAHRDQRVLAAHLAGEIEVGRG